MNYFNIKTNNRGFTLIEILVSITVFSIIIGSATTLFVFAVQIQRRVSAQQELLAQTNYVMEYMSRALIMAKKDLIGDCIPFGYNYQPIIIGGEKRGIRFLDYERYCIEFLKENNQIKKRKSSDHTIGNLGHPIPLTFPKLKVNAFNIKLHGEGQEDNFQPRITMFLDIEGLGFRPELRPEIKIQTTISQRDPDIRR